MSHVSIVVVSHSAAVANGVVELARQVARPGVQTIAAGGTGDAESPFGTNAFRIRDAIETVHGPQGTLVLCDLGSSILNAEAAIELLPEDKQSKVLISRAPLVEGTIAAVVQAGLGQDLRRVEREACDSANHRRDDEREPTRSTLPEPPSESVSMRYALRDPYGLHARAAALVIECLGGFKATAWARNPTRGGIWCNARSISALLALEVRCGQMVEIRAAGEDSADLLRALLTVLPEADASAGDPTPLNERPATTKGLACAPGFGVGRVEFVELYLAESDRERDGTSAQEETARLRNALDDVHAELGHAAEIQGPGVSRDVYRVHMHFLEDPELWARAEAKIQGEGLTAVAAWQETVSGQVAIYRALEDPVLRERALDVQDIGQRVLRRMTGATQKRHSNEQVVVVGDEILPSMLMEFDKTLIAGVFGSAVTPTSHAAILARSLGIPMVSGPEAATLRSSPGIRLAVDGDSGEVHFDPSAAKLEELYARRRLQTEHKRPNAAPSQLSIATRDGKEIKVLANVISPSDSARAVTMGANGIGLLRSEFFYMQKSAPPTEDEIVRYLDDVCAPFDGAPVTVRVFDLGADKTVPFLPKDREANPCLGLRGARLALRYRELLATELRAIARAAQRHDLRIMIPFVTSIEEIGQVRAVLDEQLRDLEKHNVPHRGNVPFGIMIEVPAIVPLVGELKGQVDFVSLGTNDLTQYLTAVDRERGGFGDLGTAIHPGVLRTVRYTVLAVRRAGIPISICGQIAADPRFVPWIVGLGVDQLSVSVDAITGVSARIRALDLGHCRGLVKEISKAHTFAGVRALLER